MLFLKLQNEGVYEHNITLLPLQVSLHLPWSINNQPSNKMDASESYKHFNEKQSRHAFD